jgi:hypothetical protein
MTPREERRRFELLTRGLDNTSGPFVLVGESGDDVLVFCNPIAGSVPGRWARIVSYFQGQG